VQLRVERAAGTVWCTLDAPPLNLLDFALIRSLDETFAALARDRSVHAAVIAGAGRGFTAGMDVRVLRDLDPGGARQLITALHAAIDRVHRAPFPVIASVHGPCLGAGFELALACDFRVAASDATLGLPEVRVGVPSVIEAALLPGLIGSGRAAELLLTGEPIGAAQALAWGLVSRVVPGGELRLAVEALLDRLAACGPRAVRLQKELMVHWRHTDLASAVAASVETFVAAYATGEPREGATAFLEKRRARFEEPA
jgi:enoyl-CoA hydratase/carnithine racemase